ncbi:hypothetical protein [Ferruginibacter sp.]
MQSLLLAFEIFQNRDRYFENVSEDKYPRSIITGQLILIFIAAFIYGTIMGSYNGVAQAISSGIKLVALIFITVSICFPSFYIVQLLLGSKMKLKQLVIILLRRLCNAYHHPGCFCTYCIILPVIAQPL